ncbi:MULTISPECIES: N-acetylmuramoyl-L-alanine amidase [Pasteurellaceae]|uniref:N-acetylmuramoyl-L-alanine amidase n=1 Tax=Pasteurella atlantica TaxID=2827233 RepID=A0AAW8CPU2_9PAST|nr:N-acetylmuramoyl-L-alanine amidase [Pasteurella atlantica]MDP8089529.1 N-acetylmuramoyl-L-alanine amidase [Pasteurella atlantica]MDP8122805.1 N-acetylmuramoyl-L-alanine amidase [Pasteurella atlantica]MDP8142534.1 N-acetylmuramoyl-L-alanine amidase [Pasteurella atlantica]MDP8158420.1 N-acetylmuramoyl-L-alanine amidase [Pasteurella atlantica]MDP8164694.1 N-acetylmuramoyl-L-alanine amidase [Pasteurella atlantica]
MSLPITKIIIHCSATQNGEPLAKRGKTAAQRIDDMHRKRGFRRQYPAIKHFNPHLKAIGFDVDGTLETGRQVGEIGAHAKHHNSNSIGICLVGGITVNGKNYGRYTKAQWYALSELLQHLQVQHPKANILGHRDLSPDLNHDGKITPNEFMKDCPCFDVWEWLDSEQVINEPHLFKE